MIGMTNTQQYPIQVCMVRALQYVHGGVGMLYLCIFTQIWLIERHMLECAAMLAHISSKEGQ